MTGTTKYVATALAVALPADLARRGAVGAALAVAAVLLVGTAAARLRAASAVIDDALALLGPAGRPAASPALVVMVPAQRVASPAFRREDLATAR